MAEQIIAEPAADYADKKKKIGGMELRAQELYGMDFPRSLEGSARGAARR